MFKIGALQPGQKCQIITLLMLPEVSISIPSVESLWKRDFNGSSKTHIVGFDFPTHSATIIMLSLFIRTVEGISKGVY